MIRDGAANFGASSDAIKIETLPSSLTLGVNTAGAFITRAPLGIVEDPLVTQELELMARSMSIVVKNTVPYLGGE
jgi:hypothetical protein